MVWRRCLVGILLGGAVACWACMAASAQEAEPVTPGEQPAPPVEQPQEELGVTPYPYAVAVTGSAVNIRGGPSTGAAVIDRVVQGDLLEVIGETGGWLHVVIPNGAVGYIYEKFTAKPASSVPPDAEAAVSEHLRQGNIHFYRKDFDSAIEEYRAALDAWSESPDAHYNLAGAYVEKGWYEEAANEYAETLGLNPNHVYSLYNLGCVHFRQGSYQEAAAQWEQVVKMRPRYLDALYNLALAYEMMEDSRSREVWQRFIEEAEKADELGEVVEHMKARLSQVE